MERRCLLFFLLVCILGFETPSIAGVRKNKKVHASRKVPKNLYQRPEHILTDEQSYLKYFGKNDASLKETYKDPKQLPDSEAGREGLAKSIMRDRLRGSFETYIASFKSNKLQQIHHAIESVKSQAVGLSHNPDGTPSAELVVGVDPWANSSKIAYMKGPVEAGIYDNNFYNTITKPDKRFLDASLNINSNLGNKIPRADVCYLLNGENVTTTLTQQLSDQVQAAISKKQPIKASDYQHYYEIRFLYNF